MPSDFQQCSKARGPMITCFIIAQNNNNVHLNVSMRFDNVGPVHSNAISSPRGVPVYSSILQPVRRSELVLSTCIRCIQSLDIAFSYQYNTMYVALSYRVYSPKFRSQCDDI